MELHLRLRHGMADWLDAFSQAMRFICGVSALIVPDNPRALMSKADRYEPVLNASVVVFAQHYGCAVLPARPYKPQDKAKIEAAVQIVERWILARLRHRRFFSLAELNMAIATLIGELNTRDFKKLPGCRREAFERIDSPALNPLPSTPYEFAQLRGRARRNDAGLRPLGSRIKSRVAGLRWPTIRKGRNSYPEANSYSAPAQAHRQICRLGYTWGRGPPLIQQQ